MTQSHRFAVATFALAFVLVSLAFAAPTSARETARRGGGAMRRIAAGTFRPFYGGATAEPVAVAAFELDVTPVTNEQFARFVRAHRAWRRSAVPRLFADENYLAHWHGDVAIGEARPLQPVTRVSWFAAQAYCEARGARLPTEAEWELAAMASPTARDASNDRAFIGRILQWYSRPQQELPNVGQGQANLYGVHDLHGVVWEWVLDFNASMLAADDRQRGDPRMERFCGGAAIGAVDTANYASFMRYAFRSSLRASYVIGNLGFRCARSVGGGA